MTQLWSVPQAVVSIDPLTPSAIELAPLSFRESLGFKPVYSLAGTVPSGMTIDPYTGEILWTAAIDESNATLDVTVKVRNPADHAALGVQSNVVQIRVNSLSPLAGYIRDVFGALLSRLPTAEELSEWTSRIQAGTSLLSFVASIAHSQEHDTILIDNVYATVLSQEPTASQSASAMAMLQSGGNSDVLTRQLLVSSEFVGLHPGAKKYVNAVNEVLLFKKASTATTRREVAWLRMGVSRARLVNWISRSQAATLAKARQLSELYLGGPSNSKILTQWATALSKGTLNSDSLTTRILASKTYANGWASRPVPNIQASAAPTSTRYNSLDHLQFGLMGVDATRGAARRPRVAALQRPILAECSERRLQRPVHRRVSHPDAIPESPAPGRLEQRGNRTLGDPARRRPDSSSPDPDPGGLGVSRAIREHDLVRELRVPGPHGRRSAARDGTALDRSNRSRVLALPVRERGQHFDRRSNRSDSAPLLGESRADTIGGGNPVDPVGVSEVDAPGSPDRTTAHHERRISDAAA